MTNLTPERITELRAKMRRGGSLKYGEAIIMTAQDRTDLLDLLDAPPEPIKVPREWVEKLLELVHEHTWFMDATNEAIEWLREKGIVVADDSEGKK